MPELPEVETIRRELEREVVGKKVKSVEVTNTRSIRRHNTKKQFIAKLEEYVRFSLPYYIGEGKSYLTIAFGCTGGHHRSVMMAEEMHKRLTKAGYPSKVSHRDIEKG